MTDSYDETYTEEDVIQNQLKYLNDNPLPWLLEIENPSVRYWTLIDILDRPADDREVLEAKAAIAQYALVQELFALQHADGHWGDDETKPYTARGAVAVLSLLHTLGVTPDERTTAGCDSFLRFCQHESGGFSTTKRRRSGIFPCTTGQHLPFLVYFGLGDDPRVRQAFAFLVEDMSTADALNCGRYQHRDCLWGAIAALNGLAALPTDMRSRQSEQVVQRLAHALLNASYDFGGEHKRWLTFGVPRAWDLLSALLALAAHAYAHDPHFAPLLELVLARQNEQGRWLCGSVSRTWPLEKRNRPSKWVTLDALRVFKRVGRKNWEAEEALRRHYDGMVRGLLEDLGRAQWGRKSFWQRFRLVVAEKVTSKRDLWWDVRGSGNGGSSWWYDYYRVYLVVDENSQPVRFEVVSSGERLKSAGLLEEDLLNVLNMAYSVGPAHHRAVVGGG